VSCETKPGRQQSITPCVMYGDGYRRLDSIRDVQSVSLPLVQLYKCEQFTRNCCSVLTVIFSMRTSTRPSYRVRFLISSFLKTILLLKMSSGKFISFRRSVNSVRQRLYIPYLLIRKQHYQQCLRNKVGAPVFSDSPHRRTSVEQILERS